MNAYRDPATRYRRRHGPTGYNDLESFRPWLRDEFVFRCVYGLERETWSNLVAAFAIDHFSPTSIDPAKRLCDSIAKPSAWVFEPSRLEAPTGRNSES